MSLSAGTPVTVADGVVTAGSRLSLAFFNAKKSAYDAAVASFTAGGGAAPTAAEKQAVFSLFAIEANAQATALIDEITTNAEVAVTINNHDIDLTGSAATGPTIDLTYTVGVQ